MARVCIDSYPVGSYPRQKEPGFHMDNFLKAQIDILIKNITRDWDFTMLITGGGQVRVGKSVLAMQIAKYWVDQLEKVHGIKVPFSAENNFVFNWDKYISKGNELGRNHRYSPLIYDEAGETMEGAKALTKELKAIRDFLRECGQYNFLNILVLPEYFDLPKGIAMTRSICLIDVYYTVTDELIFSRGKFKFFSRPNKKKLYMYGKKELNYKAYSADFKGTFNDVYTIDEKGYKKAKQVALEARATEKVDKREMHRDACFYILTKELKIKREELVKRLVGLTGNSIDIATISRSIAKFSKEMPDK